MFYCSPKRSAITALSLGYENVPNCMVAADGLRLPQLAKNTGYFFLRDSSSHSRIISVGMVIPPQTLGPL